MDKQTQPTSEPATNQLQPSDLVYVSEITRSQDERIESFCTVLRDNSRNHKIGHGIMIFETEVDGKARIGFICNTELQELRGKSGLLRAEELVALELAILDRIGVPKMEVGYEASIAACRKMWADNGEEGRDGMTDDEQKTLVESLPYRDGLEPFASDEPIPERPTVCNCGLSLVGKPFYVCVTCFAVFCPAPGCAENHEYPKFKHYEDKK